VTAALLDDLHGLPAGGLTASGLWIGYTAPRLFTRPLRPLTEDTTLGFEAIRFAENVLRVRLLPWQKWWLIHALELREDGTFRYRILLTLIARQNGKTFLLKIVALYFLYVRQVRLVLGCAQDLRIARESWDGAYDLAAGVKTLAGEFVVNPRTRPGRRDGAGYEAIVLHPTCPATLRARNQCECKHCSNAVLDDREYRVSAATKSAGRGLTVDLLIMDEFRHCTQLAWAALSKTTSAVPTALVLPISNAGTDDSEVLNTIREAALANVEDSIGVLEWSAEDGCPLDDPDGNMHANPALGYGTMTERALAAFRATDSPEVYRTEDLCQRVAALDVLVSVDRWKYCADAGLTLSSVRDRVAAVFEVSPDGAHASLIAAARFEDGRIGLDVVASWNDPKRIAIELREHLDKVKPRVFGWFPGSPGASQYAALLRSQRNAKEIAGGSVTEACQALVAKIATATIVHNNDPLLTSHILDARKFEVSDGFRFVRKGAGHCDAAYAAAGAVALADAMPAKSKNSGVWVV
jgi:hypothetical protein